MNALSFYAGPQALAQIRSHGLRAQDIAVVPAAAGGPKGLNFSALDQWLFGHWAAHCGAPAHPDWRLIGAGDAAACQCRSGQRLRAPRHTLLRAALQQHHPTPRDIDVVCQQLRRDLLVD